MTVGTSPPSSYSILPDSDRTGRIGVAYMRALCAQAGVGCSETTPGEDHLAIDMKVEFQQGDVRVQIKSGSQEPLSDGSISISVKDSWISKWTANMLPAYLVYVRLPGKDWPTILTHEPDTTKWNAYAYWARVDCLKSSPIHLAPKNRLTIDTFMQWQSDIIANF